MPPAADSFAAVLFDLDGVLTPTADIHTRAWTQMFDEFLVPRGLAPFSDDDYLRYVDGKPRFDGVRSFLASRDVSLPDGDPAEPPSQDSVAGLGNRKNDLFLEILRTDGIAPYPGSLRFLDHLIPRGTKIAVVSSSRNAREVLDASGLTPRFEVVTDGMVAAAEHIVGKPAPDMFLNAAQRLGVGPADAVVIEDAVSGVAAGRAGDFGLVVGVDRGAGAEALREHGADIVVDDLAELLDGAVVKTRAPEHLDLVRFPLDPWRLVEKEHDPEDLGLTETLFAVANGYMGMRANPEEGREAYSHGTYLNGFHETWSIHHAEDAFGFAKLGQTIVNVPDAKLLKLYIDDEPLLLTNADLEAYERVLDFRAGTLTRDLVWRTPAGKRVRVRSQRLVSLAHRHLAMLTFEVTMLDGQAPVVVSSQFLNRQDGEDEYHVARHALGHGADPRKMRSFDHRVLEPRLHRHDHRGPIDGGVVLGYRCANSAMTLACAYRHLVDSSCEHRAETTVGEDLAKTVIAARMREGDTLRITKLVTYHTSTGVPAEELADRCQRTLDRAVDDGPDTVLTEQREWLDAFWDGSDVVLHGDEPGQQAMRWNLFQLAQASAQTQEHGIAAKGVTGGGYEGHYFWDTETYIVPFLSYTSPELARKLLRFRWRQLPQARERAVELNQVGALYPWRTITGEEASAYYAAGTAQYHINAAIAFALKRYLDASGDIAFLAGEAAEILVETARLWEDLGFYATNGAEAFRIHGVTGPDEYTAVVNDNLYTNVMARFNMRYAARVVESLREWDRDAYDNLCRRIGLQDAEIKRWIRASEAIYLPYDDTLGIHPQDSMFLNLEPWDFANTPSDRYPLLLHFHPLVIYRHQVLKQADVVLAMVLRSDQFPLDQKRRNFDYYDPITTGDSSLSACVQAMAAAQIGYDDLAVEYFREALFVDLADTHGNASDGVHVASCGGTWGTVAFGFAGLFDAGAALRFTPRLPSRWEGVSFRMQRHGSRLQVDLDPTGCTVSVLDGHSVPIEDGPGGTVVHVEPGESHRIARVPID